MNSYLNIIRQWRLAQTVGAFGPNSRGVWPKRSQRSYQCKKSTRHRSLQSVHFPSPFRRCYAELLFETLAEIMCISNTYGV